GAPEPRRPGGGGPGPWWDGAGRGPRLDDRALDAVDLGDHGVEAAHRIVALAVGAEPGVQLGELPAVPGEALLARGQAAALALEARRLGGGPLGGRAGRHLGARRLCRQARGLVPAGLPVAPEGPYPRLRGPGAPPPP